MKKKELQKQISNLQETLERIIVLYLIDNGYEKAKFLFTLTEEMIQTAYNSGYSNVYHDMSKTLPSPTNGMARVVKWIPVPPGKISSDYKRGMANSLGEMYDGEIHSCLYHFSIASNKAHVIVIMDINKEKYFDLKMEKE